MVEPVGEGREVSVGVLAVVERMERPGQRGLEIAEHGVDPFEFGQVARLESPDNPGHVNTPGIGHGGKAAQAIAEHQRLRRQVGLRPSADGVEREAADQTELEMDRLAALIERDGGHKGHLVLGATPGLAASALATEVGVIELHGATELLATVMRGHGAVDLVVQQPSGGVAHAELALERQRRQPGLGLADEVDGKKPGRQRQLGVLHQAAGRQRGLMPTGVALEQLASPVADHVMIGGLAARATKHVGPARRLDRFGTLGLAAKAAEEFRDRHAVLELNAVAGHGARSFVAEHSDYCFDSSWREPAEAGL